MNNKQPSVRHKILISLANLTNEQPVHVNALIIACWKAFPNTFSLDPEEYNYPASHLVTAKLSGENGLIDLGWIERTATNMYRPTPRGLEVANAFKTKSIKDAKRTARQRKMGKLPNTLAIPTQAGILAKSIDRLLLVPCIADAVRGRGRSITQRDAAEMRQAWPYDPDNTLSIDEQMLAGLAAAHEYKTLSEEQQKAVCILRPLVSFISKKYPLSD